MTTPLRPATAADHPAILTLLAAADLPATDVPEHAWVVQAGDRLIATAGWDRLGDLALLRSVAVDPSARKLGIASQLVETALSDAARAGCTQAGLLTTTATGLFARLGFATIARDQADASLQASAAFQSVCPQSAQVMQRALALPAAHGDWLRVRPASRDDMSQVLAIYNHEVRTSTSTYQYVERTLDEQVAQWDAKQADRHGFFVAVDSQGKVWGYANYGLYRPREGWRFACEHSVYIHPDARGLGIARLLMPAILAHAASRGFHRMVGVVDAANDASMKLHARFGFETMGIMHEGGYKFDRWLDVAFVVAKLG